MTFLDLFRTRKERGEKEYRTVLIKIALYLFKNRKEIAKKLTKKEVNKWGNKSFNIGSRADDGYYIRFEINE